MTPETLAALHSRCFVVPRPYTAAEFADLLGSDRCFLETAPHGFALGRAVADEAELLTLAVDPAKRRQGTGAALLARFHEAALRRGARRAFLEVAADNAAAVALYAAAGYVENGRRGGYYRHPDGSATDALTLTRTLADT